MTKEKRLTAKSGFDQAAFNRMMDAQMKTGAHVIDRVADLIIDLFPPKKEISKLEEPTLSPTPQEAEIKTSPPLVVEPIKEKPIIPFSQQWAKERSEFLKRLG